MGDSSIEFNYQWTDYEVKQAKHMQDTFEEVLSATGGTLLGDKSGADRQYGLTKPGEIIHEVGTTRMGKNPKTSVKLMSLINCTTVTMFS